MSNINEVKIKLEGLQIGMYVSRTDREWSDLPVHFEGFLISSNQEIDMLSEYCNAVYIDTSKGSKASPFYLIQDSKVDRRKNIDLGKNEYTILRKENYKTISSLKEELHSAKYIYGEIEKQISKVFDNLEQGHVVETYDLEEAVSQSVDSILRNPTAFKLFLEMKNANNSSYSRALIASVWSAQFGRHLGLEKQSIDELALGGLLMDIGKSRIPENLLEKDGDLTAEEFIILRSHVNYSIEILIKCENIPNNVMRMVSSHHERADGTGYPLGLMNKDIPIFGRIAGIVDSFDAMTSKSPFGSVMLSPHQAISDLYRQRGNLFQADLVEQFIQTVGIYPTGTMVELSTGEVAVVTTISAVHRLRPSVILILDKNKQLYKEFNSIDLSREKDKHIKWDLKHGVYGINMDELFL